jgi:DNA repair protein RecN (Recombination protein N)
MLVELHIENLGVIESLRLPVRRGFTVLTGETGAGKTMLVEAINLVVGGRADASIVRTGAQEARVEAVFHIQRDGVDEEVILSRIVPVDGRSRAYVNNRPVTVANLSEVGADLIDIHGQHAHQKLLSASAQRDALDQFAGVDLEPINAARRRLVEIDAAMAALGGDERMRAREIDLLSFQCKEIEGAAIEDADEDKRLQDEEDVLSDAVNIRESLMRSIEVLGSDAGALDKVGLAIAAIESAKVSDAARSRLKAIFADLDDVTRELRGVADSVEEDPERLNDVQERRRVLRDIMKKYGDTLSDVIQYGHEARQRLDELTSYSDRISELEREKSVALSELRRAQEVVGKARRASAPALSAEITNRLSVLAMENAQVVVDVGDGDDDPSGDRVVFLLSANPGSPLLPLTKVASGGELARTMLSLRLTLSTDPATMIFDEVDAGIGGAAAVAVADALAQLGEKHQVLAVTHLGQMAATAHHHVHVTKEIVDGNTFGRARELDADERVEELARMLSGGLADDSARQHARDMLAAKSTGSGDRTSTGPGRKTQTGGTSQKGKPTRKSGL